MARAADAAAGKPLSPNDKPGVALIGCGGRGRGVAGEAAKLGQMLAVCDVDDANLAEARKTWPDAKPFKDFRKVMERDDIHVIVNGTPDHWHTFVNLAAMKAGKDVYSEKPLTLTIDEGRRLVKAARDTKCILQTGSQQRSDKNFRLACELVRNGRIGKLKHVSVWLPSGRREGPFASSPVPDGFDWDMWLGQTPMLDYVKERTHVTFRYWWEYSGGTMTDWGAHHNDIVLWGLGRERSGPVHITGKPLVGVHHLEDIGLHYALTLKPWRLAFLARVDEVRALGFDDRFLRMWEYYLCLCEAAFATRTLSNLQVVLTRPGNAALPGIPAARSRPRWVGAEAGRGARLDRFKLYS